MSDLKSEPTIVPAENRHGIDWQQSLTRRGNKMAEVLSAVIKEIRRGEEEKSLYWALEMAYCGKTAEAFLWECLLVCVVEDIGLANPLILPSIQAAQGEYFAMPEKDHRRLIFLSFAITHLCRSAKSRYVIEILQDVQNRAESGEMALEIPDYAVDVHTRRGKDLGRGTYHYLTEGAHLENRDRSLPEIYHQRLIKKAGDVKWVVTPAA